MPKILAEYIWVDGQIPTAVLRSKTKVLDEGARNVELGDLPDWGFDGSSTSQGQTTDSDRDLVPCRVVPDPIRGGRNRLVLCEVYLDGKPHPSNTRAVLQQSQARYQKQGPWFGIEQEYTLYDADGGHLYRWPSGGTANPGPQGKYYCGVGSDEVHGRHLIEAHTKACLDSGLRIAGTNAEVMPSQWEFQIGIGDPLQVADDLWIARWLLYRLGEDIGISAKLNPKPISGNWNGAGAHTNFSTHAMRDHETGHKAIKDACQKLAEFHNVHILDYVYGEFNDRRLTGEHETSNIDTFSWGAGNRGASVRIPGRVQRDGMGYLEDRRPAANMDPYRVCTAMLETICGKGFDPSVFMYFAPKKRL